MQWRAGLVALAVLVGLSGLVGPAMATPAGGLAPAAVDAVETPTPAANNTTAANATPPADPETDVLGWEEGYWYNESIAINQTDGFNATELNATVARAMARVEVVRQLEFARTVPVTLESREDYQARRANDTTNPTLRTFDNVKFEALFLVGEDDDSIEVQNTNAGAAIGGFYSPGREAIVLIAEEGTNLQINERTLAHELTHALQDQHFNLSNYRARTRDGANAQNGLIEGDASLVEYRYNQRCEAGTWNGSCVSPPENSGGGGSGLANIGTYIVKFHPYSDGPAFLSTLYKAGGWAAVNEAYARPPNSSEQVIHPEKYLVDEPTAVHLEDRQTDGWERVAPPNRPNHATVGEAALTSMLVFPLYDSNGQTQIIRPDDWLNQTDDGELSSFDPLNYDNPYAAGWDGDRLHVYENDANETAYVWRLVWDSPAEAREFLDGYSQVLQYWGAESVRPGLWVIDEGAFADAFAVEVEGDTVTVVNAPTVEELYEIRPGFPPTATPSPAPTTEPVVGAGTEPPVGSSETTTPGQPGFGVLAALAAIGSLLLWRYRRT